MKGHVDIYRKLSEIVNDALDDVQAGMHWQYRFTRWAMKYAEEIHFDHAKDVRTVEVNFKPWKAIELPQDCVDWVLVGIQNGEDIMTFTKDERIAMLFQKDSNGQLMPNNPPTYETDGGAIPFEGDYMWPWINLTHLGEDPGRMFGLRVKSNGFGYFTENRNKDISELQFSGSDIDTTQKVYLMYISNLFSPTEETLIHPYHAEYIVAGIHREFYRHKPNVTGIEKQQAEAEFDRQYLKVLDRSWDLRVEDIYEYLKARYQMTPRIP